MKKDRKKMKKKGNRIKSYKKKQCYFFYYQFRFYKEMQRETKQKISLELSRIVNLESVESFMNIDFCKLDL